MTPARVASSRSARVLLLRYEALRQAIWIYRSRTAHALCDIAEPGSDGDPVYGDVRWAEGGPREVSIPAQHVGEKLRPVQTPPGFAPVAAMRRNDR